MVGLNLKKKWWTQILEESFFFTLFTVHTHTHAHKILSMNSQIHETLKGWEYKYVNVFAVLNVSQGVFLCVQGGFEKKRGGGGGSVKLGDYYISSFADFNYVVQLATKVIEMDHVQELVLY